MPRVGWLPVASLRERKPFLRCCSLKLLSNWLVQLVVAYTFASTCHAADWVRKSDITGWTWFEDYVYAYATYVVACEQARECQVGMGVFAFGEPRGEKIKFSGEQEITVIGVGSIHIRASDGLGPVKAAIIPKDATPVKTPPLAW